MSPNEESERERWVFAEFAQAGRIERDRIACAHLDAEDHRFESSPCYRAVAEILAARLIATVAR